MKKLIISIAVVVLINGMSLAQGIYLRAGGGYGFPAATSSIGENYLHTTVYDVTAFIDEYSTEVVSASYGAGTNFNFAVGFKFNENMILDLNIIYLAGRKFETSYIYTYSDNGYETREENIFTSHGSGLLFNPTLIFSAGFGVQVPYARFGIIAASPKITEQESFYYNTDGEGTQNYTWEYGGGLSIGYQTAVGMNWKITDRIDIYTEANFVSMTFYPKEANMTKYTVDGVDMLDQLLPGYKQKVFEKSFDPYIEFDPNEPEVVARESTPFSYVSFQAGIRFTILKFTE